MEIQKTTKQGTIKISASIMVFCSITESPAGPTEVMGSIQRDGNHAGTVTVYPSGRVVVYFEADSGLTKEEKKKVFSSVIDDAEKVFTPQES